MRSPNQFGVITARSYWEAGAGNLAVMRTEDRVTHYIRIISYQAKWLRYVLRHDLREYLIVSTMVEIRPEDETVTCVGCLAVPDG